jgi:ferric enterobactin receptor
VDFFLILLWKNMIKPLLTTVLCFVYALCSSAQTLKEEGVLTGRVIDEHHNNLPWTTVTLIDQYTGTAFKVVQTDSAGQFYMDEIPYGPFNCQISRSGYKTLAIDSIVFTPTSGTINLGDLSMTPLGKVLEEITVTGRSPTIRSGLEKKVYSVNQSLISLGGSASDVLQNVPTLQVDPTGNISLRGSTNVKVLVDGKTSLIGGGSVTQILQSLPASSIDRIEIITSPSAKYDADGSAIVNIVLKKNNASGFNGSLAATAGTRNNYTIAGTVSDQIGRFNWYGNYSYQHRNTYSNGYQDMTFLQMTDPAYYSNETFPSVTIVDVQSAKAGVDYRLSSKDVLSLSGVYAASVIDRNEWLTVNNLTESGMPVDLSTRHNLTSGNGNSEEVALDYTHSFKRPQEQLTFDFDYARSLTDNTQLYNTYFSNVNGISSDSTAVLKDIKRAFNRNYNLQLDYATPLGKNAKLEAGWRSQLGSMDNQQWDYSLDEESNDFAPDFGLINQFNSTTQIHAAYLSYRRQIRSFTFQLGLREEWSRFNGHLHSFDSSGQAVTQPVSVNTQGLYPSLRLVREVGEGKQWELSYSRRVNRPTPRELNPFYDVSDPVNYEQGNPYLLPESIHSVELTYLRNWSNGSISTGAYYTQINDVIKHVQTDPVNDVVITIAQNLKYAINTGLEFIGNFHPSKAWDFTLNANLYERFNAGDSAYGISPTQGLSWNANITSNYYPLKNLAIQLRADYKAADIIIQDREHPAYGLDGAVRYDFCHKRGSLALNGRDIFNTRKWRFLRESDALWLNFERYTYSARASLTFTWRFGKSSASVAKPRLAPSATEGQRIENR